MVGCLPWVPYQVRKQAALHFVTRINDQDIRIAHSGAYVIDNRGDARHARVTAAAGCRFQLPMEVIGMQNGEGYRSNEVVQLGRWM